MKRSNAHFHQRDSSFKSSAKRTKFEPSRDEFKKLDQSDATAARKIQSRRKQVQKGKNTAGYDAYIEQIPKHKRRPRDPTQPSTPDHTLDIPNKRWQGQLKAWRKALHQYDPPDLMRAFDDEAAANSKETPAKTTAEVSVQAKQLSDAVEKGLLVDVSESTTTTGASPGASLVSQHDVASPEVPKEPADELDAFDQEREEFFLEENDSDSDDDLL